MSLLSERDEAADLPEPVVEREPLSLCVPFIVGCALLAWLVLIWLGIAVLDFTNWMLGR